MKIATPGLHSLHELPASRRLWTTFQSTINVKIDINTAALRVDLYNHSNSGWVAFDDVMLTAVTTSTATIRCSSYNLAGQRIAVRVTGTPAGSGHGLYYVYSDHASTQAQHRLGQQQRAGQQQQRRGPRQHRPLLSLRRLPHHAQPDDYGPAIHRAPAQR
jgi:hypothetical protein